MPYPLKYLRLTITLVAVITFGAVRLISAQSPEGEAVRLGSATQDASNIEPRVGSSANTVTVSNGGTVDLHVVDMPLATVLRMLNTKSRRNIIVTPSVQGTVTAELYDVSFDEALRAILTGNNCEYEVRDKFIYVRTVDEMASLRRDKPGSSAAGEMSTHQVFWLDYVDASEAETIVKPLLSEQGSITSSTAAREGSPPSLTIGGEPAGTGKDYIVVFDEPERLSLIAEVISEIDIKPPQVLVEATIMRARLNEENALGIDFTTVGGIDFEMLGSTSPAAQSITTGNTPQSMLGDTTLTVRTDFNANIASGGFTFGIIKDQVGLFIRALEQITDVEILANPKLLALNKQVGKIIVGRRDGYLTTTVTETSAIQDVKFLETGTQLTFRPFIGNDGYVRMEIRPEDSVGGLTPAQLPFEQTTEVTTTVLVRDGHTILIGGLFREVSSAARDQVPLLGDFPVIGNLFRSRNDSIDREEVIILLTVHIVKDEDDYADRSENQLEDAERARVGMRRGMMWHGRERLSQSHYRKAIEHFAGGQLEKALWNVRMALHNQPRFIAAIDLKEEIEQAREWEEDGAVTREFIWDIISNDRQDGDFRFGRPTRRGQGGADPDAVGADKTKKE